MKYETPQTWSQNSQRNGGWEYSVYMYAIRPHPEFNLSELFSSSMLASSSISLLNSGTLLTSSLMTPSAAPPLRIQLKGKNRGSDELVLIAECRHYIDLSEPSGVCLCLSDDRSSLPIYLDMIHY